MRAFLLPAAVLPALLFGAAQETAEFRHPRHPVSIEAPSDWAGAPWPGDSGVYEVSAPDGSVRVLLWFTLTEQPARGYLRKMVDMKPVEPVGAEAAFRVDGREAWRVEAAGSEQGDEGVREILATIQVGEPGPESGSYVFQVWCPGPRAGELRPLMEEILASLRIDPVAG